MILVIGAMLEEITALKIKMTDIEEKEVQGIRVVSGMVDNATVLLALSGVGKVNAAFTTATLSQHFDIQSIINIGSAGGLQDGQNVGDIVLSTQCQYHDLDIGPTTHTDPRFIFKPETSYLPTLETIIESMDLNCHTGLLLAGDQFITNQSPHFKIIQDLFPCAVAVDMESAAIAAVATRLKIPFVILRSLSDVTLHHGNELTFEEYLPLASENSAKICIEFIKKEFA
ncbi:5'-methylthioadenosine/adenosylhomocysteine nucleosidase [Erysipelothrix urinaevulpis]|uniref:5'-methylthioadenosine/adenosylhomocysteine nucleosidase n=1 Tax=Erysipelothrix urinaevulpis TaxID=2683717 RepID=UPI0013587374|nr:5'-methylthioadenosine/adenosylhomocysteine nucleosidase [Erysipelothrix urinaevulpis]